MILPSTILIGGVLKKTQQMIWQAILEYAKIAGDKENNKATNYDDILGKYDKIWGTKWDYLQEGQH